jgi:hypothetical protein
MREISQAIWRLVRSFTLEQVTDNELEALLVEESDTVERTVSVRDTDKFGEAICAFANDLPQSVRMATFFLNPLWLWKSAAYETATWPL